MLMLKDLCFEIIQTCPNKCKFCSSNSSKDKKTIIPIEHFKRAVTYFINQGGIGEISISGGEPFLHPDLFEMVKFCRDNGLRTVIFTSGIKRNSAIPTEVIEYIKENKIKYLFISGDLYEHKYVRQSTIEYINKLFKEIPETKIFIAPGNHDPYLKNSYYNKFNWNENVKIFNSEIEKIELPEVDIYGYGFDDFYCNNSNIENIEIENKEKINILITHATLDAGNNVEKNYNILSSKKLKEKNFDYIALGHIHKLDFNTEEQQRIAYPGSTVSLGFDEPGKHGMIVGELEKENINLTFVPLDEEQFVKENIDVTNMFSKEELIENINELEIKEDEYVEVTPKAMRMRKVILDEIERKRANKS